MVVVEPYYVKRIIHDDAMHAAMFICRKAKLPSRHCAKMIV
jgi:hypothetical protein